jgi:tRNA/rRNA methyltransferase
MRVVTTGVHRFGVSRAETFGCREMVLVAPRCRRDQRAYALASHAGDVLDDATEAATLVEALQGCTYALGTAGRDRSEEPSPTLSPAEGVAMLPAAGGAIVFGPEDHGLSNQDLDHCQGVVTIPTDVYASVNLAQAVNILCYVWHTEVAVHDARGARGDRDSEQAARHLPAAPGALEGDVASRDQYEQMYAQLRDTMLLIGYTDPNRLESIMRMYRGFLDRARLTPDELAAVRGLWSQASWAARLEPDDLPGRDGKR